MDGEKSEIILKLAGETFRAKTAKSSLDFKQNVDQINFRSYNNIVTKTLPAQRRQLITGQGMKRFLSYCRTD